jgi:N6-adenosine-specific RNA methylase IME4
MTLEEICALPVVGVTTPDAILFLWTTSPKMKEAVQVIEAWGFDYRTMAVWDKQHIGMGYYFRQQHERLMVATRGSMPTPMPSARPPSLVFRISRRT